MPNLFCCNGIAACEPGSNSADPVGCFPGSGNQFNIVAATFWTGPPAFTFFIVMLQQVKGSFRLVSGNHQFNASQCIGKNGVNRYSILILQPAPYSLLFQPAHENMGIHIIGKTFQNIIIHGVLLPGSYTFNKFDNWFSSLQPFTRIKNTSAKEFDGFPEFCRMRNLYKYLFTLVCFFVFTSAAIAQRAKNELHTGLSLLHLTKGPAGFGAAFHLTGVFHFTPHSSVTLGVEPFFFDRGRYDLNGFDIRAGYRYTSWESGVFIHPNIGLVHAKLNRLPGTYTGFLKALEVGVRLPTRRFPVELAASINASDYLDNNETDLRYQWIWGAFKMSIVFPVR